MKSLPPYFYVIVLLIGGLVSRECVTGSLQNAEKTYASWLEETTVPNPIPEITLITADTSGQLSSLDVALFLRAAFKFKAEVAALAAYEFAPGDEDLLKSVLNRESHTAVVVGALLNETPGGSVNFQTVNWKSPAELPKYSGVRNSLPAELETVFGFLNFPENETPEAVPVLSQLNQQTVASFSFACLTRYLAMNQIKLLPGSVGNELLFSNQSRLSLGSRATVKLQPETYSKIARFSLGDLLLASEKSEQEATEKFAVIDAIRDRIVVLAPAPSNDEIAGGTFTLGQYQALCIASIVNQMHRLNLGVWIWLIPFVWFFPWLKISECWNATDQLIALIMVAAFYGLFSGSLAQAYGIFLPGIPALAWFLSILGVILARRKSASA